MIRPYVAEDEEVLIDLLRQNTPQYFAPEEEADFVRYLKLTDVFHFVYTNNGQVIGCAGYGFKKIKKEGMVSWFLVDQDCQGQGIGRSLLEHCLKELKKISSLEKIVVRTSQLVYPFFEKSGFVLDFIEKDYWAPGYDLYYMSLRTD